MSETAVAAAKATLLRALDQLQQAESDLEDQPDRVDLIVVYSIGRDCRDGDYHEVGGWASTAGPQWMFAALMRRAAEGFNEKAIAVDDEPDDPDTEE